MGRLTALKPPLYDIADFGYQQFDMIDDFNIFENPHGIDSQEEAKENTLVRGVTLKVSVWNNKIDETIRAIFPPGSTGKSQTIYFSYAQSLQYIFIRDYQNRTVLDRINLAHFPTCLSMLEMKDIKSGVQKETQFFKLFNPQSRG
jgi:hypothetical protein